MLMKKLVAPASSATRRNSHHHCKNSEKYLRKSMPSSICVTGELSVSISKSFILILNLGWRIFTTFHARDPLTVWLGVDAGCLLCRIAANSYSLQIITLIQLWVAVFPRLNDDRRPVNSIYHQMLQFLSIEGRI